MVQESPTEPREPTATTEPLIRQLTVLGIWMIAINGTIGAGIFGTPGKLAAEVGLWSPYVFLLSGILMAPIVLSFAEVASAFRGTGGPVLYTRAAFGSFVSFQAGWAYYIARLSASAANIGLLVATLGWFRPAVEHWAVRATLLVVVTGALTFVNVVGTRHAMRSIGVLTVLKFGPLLAVASYGLMHVGGSAFSYEGATAPEMSHVGVAVMLSVYAFVGWETALVPAGESRDPARDMPRALLWALAISTVLYFVIQLVSVRAVPDLGQGAGRPLVRVGEALFGAFGGGLLTFGIVVSVGGNVASAVLSTPRITYAMARDGNLPRAFGAVHERYRTPWISVLVYGGLVLALALTGTFVELAMVSVLTRLLIYLGVVLTVPHVRRRERAEGQFRLPGGYAIPGLACIVCIGLMSQVTGATLLRAAIYLGVGSLLFVATRFAARRR